MATTPGSTAEYFNRLQAENVKATTDLPSPNQAPPAPSIPPIALEPIGDTHPSRVRPLDDNVLLYLKPRPERISSGSLLVMPANRQAKANGAREAIVLASGPGWRLRGGRGPLVPTEVEPGQCVVVDEKAGQDWSLDVAKPRTNPHGCAWASFPVPTQHERVGGEYRMVRADEILFHLEDQRPEDEALELDYGDGRRRV